MLTVTVLFLSYSAMVAFTISISASYARAVSASNREIHRGSNS
jgi:hypothetical protein